MRAPSCARSPSARRSSRTSFYSSLIRSASDAVVPGRAPASISPLLCPRCASPRGGAPSSSAILQVRPLRPLGVPAGPCTPHPGSPLTQPPLRDTSTGSTPGSDPSVHSPPPSNPAQFKSTKSNEPGAERQRRAILSRPSTKRVLPHDLLRVVGQHVRGLWTGFTFLWAEDRAGLAAPGSPVCGGVATRRSGSR